MTVKLLCCISMLLLLSCGTSKKSIHSMNEAEGVRKQIERFIACLNARDFDCVETCYAEDFASFNPLVHFDTKAALMNSIRKNYTENQYRLEVKIAEVDAGNRHAHALLRWKMFSKQEGSQEELIYDKMNFTIWKKSAGTNWQLSRMLFFFIEQ